MNNRVSLHVPQYSELEYRQKLLSQPETMNYNRGYNLNFEGYDKETGCIKFPKIKWQNWYSRFVNSYPLRYYAFIVNETNEFIGEVNFHKAQNQDWFDMGIVIEGKYRRQGYAVEALKIMLKVAFEEYDVDVLHNDFEVERSAAAKAHYLAGFHKKKVEDGVLHLIFTKDDYVNITK